MGKNKILDITNEIMDEFLQREEGKDLYLYHTEFVKEGPDRILRVYIDKKNSELGLNQNNETYVSTEDCEKVSRYLSDELDKNDPTQDNYILEVSSPGLDRVLVTEEHFKRYIGELVEVSLYKELEGFPKGTKKIQGVLKSYNDGDIEIEIHDTLIIKSKDIAKVNLAVVI